MSENDCVQSPVLMKVMVTSLRVKADNTTGNGSSSTQEKHHGGCLLYKGDFFKEESYIYGRDLRDHGNYEVIKRFKKLLIFKRKKHNKRKEFQFNFQSQSDECFEIPTNYIRSSLRNCDDYTVKLIEDIVICGFQLSRSVDYTSICLNVLTFIKLRSNRSLCKGALFDIFLSKFKELFASSSSQNWSDSCLEMRDIFEHYERVVDAPVFQKMYKFFMYCMSYQLLDKFGITFDALKYNEFEQAAIKGKYSNRTSFAVTIIDTVTFFLERGVQCFRCGSVDPIFHSGENYEKWYSKSIDLREKGKLLFNSQLHGIDRFAMEADLLDCIEKGDSIIKHFPKTSAFEKRFMQKELSELKMLKYDMMTKRDAQKRRVSPFGILVNGSPATAKTVFTEMLQVHYANKLELPQGDEFIYFRNPKQAHWDGFQSYKWCIIIDDIADLRPSATNGPDPSVVEIIQIKNETPLIPPMADLPDKGKNPVKCKLVLATTNTRTLNAYHYFSCPYAVQRRFPFVVTLFMKDEYSDDYSMLDPKKIPPAEPGVYADLWTIVVEEVVPDYCNMSLGKFNQIGRYEHFVDFLVWYNKAIDDHEAKCVSKADAEVNLKSVILCRLCYLPTYACKCSQCDYDCKEEELEVCVSLGKTPDDIVEEIDTDDLETVFTIPEYEPSDELSRQIFNRIEMCCHTIYNMLLYHFWRFFIELLVGLVYLSARKCVGRTASICFANAPRLFFYLAYGSDGFLRLFGLENYSYRFTHTVLYYIDKRDLARHIGARAFKRIHNNRYSTLLEFMILTAGSLTAITFGLKYVNSLIHTKVEKDEHDDRVRLQMVTEKACQTEDINPINFTEKQQFKVYIDEGRPCIPHIKERENVWVKNDYELTPVDLTPQITSSANLSIKDFSHKYVNNCVRLELRKYYTDRTDVFATNAFGIAGQYYLANYHAMIKDFTHVRIIDAPLAEGASSNLNTIIDSKHMWHFPDMDLTIIKIIARPPVRDCRQYFAKKTYRARHHGMYLIREPNGVLSDLDVKQITYRMMASNLGMMSGFVGNVDVPTKNGDCGSPLFADLPQGKCILGIHSLGHMKTTGSIQISSEFLQSFFLDKNVISAYKPSLNTDKTKHLLGQLHYKSEIRFIKEAEVRVYGSFVNDSITPKSNVCLTPISESLSENGYVVKFAKPVMNGYEPWRNALIPLVEPLKPICYTILKDCAKAYFNDIVCNLDKKELKSLHVLSDDEAVFGADGVAYIDRINMSSSAGHPWKHCKKSLFYEDKGDRGMTPELQERVDNIINLYKSGKRYCPIFTSHLKDEPRPFKKIFAKNTRVFSGGPVDWIIVQRKYLLSFVRLMQNFKFVFENAPGTVAQSIEWQNLYEYLTKFGRNSIIAGDFAHFDKSMMSVLIRLAYKIIIYLYKYAGADQQTIRVIYGLMLDTMFAWTNYHGTLMEFLKGNPSGHSLTVIINGLVLCIIFRYAYLRLHPSYGLEENKNILLSYKNNVNSMNYGDDNIHGVSESAPWFNHGAIVTTLRELGMTYTMADKEALSVPFICIDDATFLKRSWRFDEDIGAWVGPLEHDSIEKMLMVWIRSKTVSEEEQICAVLASAIREYFWYGKSTYEIKRQLLLKIAVDYLAYIQPSTFPTWDLLKESFWELSTKLQPQSWSSNGVFEDTSWLIPQPTTSSVCSYCTYGTCRQCASVRMDEQRKPLERSSNSLFSVELGGSSENVESVKLMRVTLQSKYPLNKQNEKCCFCSQRKRTNTLYSGFKKLFRGKHQSLNQTIMSFHDEAGGNKQEIPHGREETQDINYTELSSLKNFLSRPTLINSLTWVEGTAIPFTDIYPWRDFLNNTRIKKKLDNFNFLRGRLHLKAVISSSPFYYGLVQYAYQPYQALTNNAFSSAISLVPMSQRYGIWIKPAANQGGELVVPFFYNKDWLDISSAGNTVDMGRIHVNEFVPLASANAVAVEDVTIQLYAWMDDVEICGPTLNLALQSDEYSEKPISKTANAVASVAAKFESVPMIGSFATATKGVANALGAAASLFGFTDPPNIENVCAFKNLPFHGMAGADISEPVSKLTLDAKSELSLDPKIVGLDETDELSIKYIASKYSYLTQANWASSDAVNSIRFYAPVTPAYRVRAAASLFPGVYAISLTPAAHLAQVFANWKGSITYKIQVICSKYHRGRLLFTWDPSGNLATTTDTVNTSFTKLLDIGENTEYEITVPYLQARPWLFTEYNINGDVANLFQTSGFASTLDTSRHNGSISIQVFNLLTAPVTSADVKILIYVKGGDDLEFANPVDINNNYTFFLPQSDQFTEDQVISSEETELFTEGTTDKIYHVNFADPIRSMRLLLRRATMLDMIPLFYDANYNIYKFTIQQSRFPAFSGYATTSPYLANNNSAGLSPYYFCFNTPLSWMTPCFVGQRGSTRWYYNIIPANGTFYDHMRVQRRLFGTSSGVLVDSRNEVNNVSGKVARFALSGARAGVSGEVLMNQRTQTGLSVEFPMQSLSRMYNCEVVNQWTGKAIDQSDSDGYFVEFIKPGFNSALTDLVERHVSIGADFNFHYYLNAPDCWWCPVPTIT